MSSGPNTPSSGAPALPPLFLEKQYVPAQHEGRIRARWEQAKAGAADPARVASGKARPYTIFIPPPNVTDRLHLGHALNNTLQDVLARAHRMMGFETLWMPGTDHAGIATQTVVEKRLKREEGKGRTQYARDEFVAKVQAFKDEYEATISGQLRAMGCSCDWDRQRFTMDAQCSRAVREAFFRLFKDGLLYRGKRLVNWDPVTQTALADDEVEMEEVDGFFYYLRYPLVKRDEATGRNKPVMWADLAALGYPGAAALVKNPDEQAWVTVATTRPETYLGDTAVAINPRDPRAAALRGLCVSLPIVGRVIPIVEDDYVVMPAADPNAPGIDPKAKFATGFLKVTPAHDANDYEIGLRHKLPMINILGPDASISDKHGWTDIGGAEMFVGMARELARREVVNQFSRRGLLEDQKTYRHQVGHSYRSHAPIEPWLSDQWYVRVTDDRLAGAALRAMAADQRTSPSPTSTGKGGDGGLRFYPERYARTYQQWHENIRDWCVSRQLWWGHRIPVWSMLPDIASIKKGERLDDSEYVEDIFLNRAASAFDAFVKKAGLEDQLCLRRDARVQWRVCARTEKAVAAMNALEQAFSRRLMSGAGDDPQGAAGDDVLAKAGFSHCAAEIAELLPALLFVEQESDVLDTWFSSALWPISTLGWPEKSPELAAFNPSDALCTAREIITLWVSRMVMFNRFFLGQDDLGPDGAGKGRLPFKDVFIHAMIQDEQGRKMSKSLGNGVDPLDIISSHGADAMRFTLCQMTTNTQDVRMPVDMVCPHCGCVFAPKWDAASLTQVQALARSPKLENIPDQKCPQCSKGMLSLYGVFNGYAEPDAARPQARNTSSKFDLGRNFTTKLWNAARFTISMLEKAAAGGAGSGGAGGTGAKASLTDRWMLSRLAETVATCERALKEYEYSVYAAALYDLLWRDFCDWYLEAIKPTVQSNPAQQAVLRTALDVILRLMYPVMPFVTEAVYEQLSRLPRGAVQGVTLSEAPMLCRASWPKIDAGVRDAGVEAQVDRLRALVTAVNQVRAQHNVPPRRKIVLHASAALAAEIASGEGCVEALAGLASVSAQAPGAGEAAVPVTFGAAELKLSSLADAVDAAADCERLVGTLIERTRDVQKLEARLNAPGYAQRAPAHLVEQSRQQLATKTAERDAVLASLGTVKAQAVSLLGDKIGALEGELEQITSSVTSLSAAAAPENKQPTPEQKKAREELKKAKEQLAAKAEERDAAKAARERLA